MRSAASGIARRLVQRPGQRQRRRLGAGPQVLLQLVDRLLLVELRHGRIGDGRLDHLEQRALALLARIGGEHGRRHAGPRLHRLGRVFLGDLEDLARLSLQADLLVVHHVGVGLHALEDEVRIEGHVAVEQRLADHVGGERPRLLDHLDGLARLGDVRPDVHLGADGGQEVGDVLGEHVRVERRLLRHADLLPEHAVVGDHRLAEDRLQAVEILDVGVGLRHQHVLEVLGLAQQDDALIGKVNRDDRAIALRHLHDDAQGIVEPALQQGRQLEPDARFIAQALGMRGSLGVGCRLLSGNGHDVSPARRPFKRTSMPNQANGL